MYFPGLIDSSPAYPRNAPHRGTLAVVRPPYALGASMVALKTERRAFLWRIKPRPMPDEAGEHGASVTLDEIVTMLEGAVAAGKANCYLSNSRILEDDDENKDEKNQIYIARIRRNKKTKTVTLLINRGDPNAVSPGFISADDRSVRTVDPGDDESPGWSAHLVISTAQETGKDAGKHRACFAALGSKHT